MLLELRVKTHKGQPPLKPLSASFGPDGGTLGRGANTHFCIPDPERELSRQHAVIHYENERFYLTDTSLNGTRICNRNLTLHKGHKVLLAHGDLLKIGSYEIEVSIPEAQGSEEKGFNWGPLGFEPPRDSESIRIKKFAGNLPKEPDVPPDSGASCLHGKPQVSWEPLADGELLNLFFNAARIQDTSHIRNEEMPELMRTVGAVFRVLVDGLMTVLRGRTELKAQLGLPVTVLKPTENNPLKFSKTGEEALKLMLMKKDSGFVDPVEAVGEAYEDIMNHQLATNAGIQASLMKILGRFDPQEFAKSVDEGIVFQRKAKCWDAYSEAYGKIVRDALDNFFGEEFVRGYEAQMARLRSAHNKG